MLRGSDRCSSSKVGFINNIFLATILGVLATDLLIGVGIGIVVEFVIHLSRGLKLRKLFSMAYHVFQTDKQTYNIGVSGAAAFSNIISLKSLLAGLPRKKQFSSIWPILN